MKRLIQLLVFILFIIAFIYLGTKDYKIPEKKQIEVKTTSDVLLKNDTVFTETNHSKVLSKLSSGSNIIIYACVDENKLCSKYGLLINEVAKEYNIDGILYYDFKEDREKNNATYQKILTKLSPFLLTDDLGKQNLYAPTLIFIKNGIVYSFDDSLAMYRGEKTADEIWDEETINLKRSYLNEIMKGYVVNE